MTMSTAERVALHVAATFLMAFLTVARRAAHRAAIAPYRLKRTGREER